MFYVRDDSGGLAVLTEEEAAALLRWLTGVIAGPGNPQSSSSGTYP
jgi:hypothetical protein